MNSENYENKNQNETEEVLEVEDKIDPVVELANTQKDLLLLRAEFENYRKRLNKTTEQRLKFATQPLATDLLRVYDNFTATLDTVADEAIRNGIQFMRDYLESVLKEHGVTKILTTIGTAFDPQYHEAVEAVNQGGSETIISEVILDGFMLHDRVIRPTRVKVESHERIEQNEDTVEETSTQP